MLITGFGKLVKYGSQFYILNTNFSDYSSAENEKNEMGLENGSFDYSSEHQNNLNELGFNLVQWRKYEFSKHLLTHWFTPKFL